MSNDDRFKQARRSLLVPQQEPFDEERTELVDLASLEQQYAAQQQADPYAQAQAEDQTAVVDVSGLRAQELSHASSPPPRPPPKTALLLPPLPATPPPPPCRPCRRGLPQQLCRVPRPAHPCPRSTPRPSFGQEPYGDDFEDEKTEFIEFSPPAAGPAPSSIVPPAPQAYQASQAPTMRSDAVPARASEASTQGYDIDALQAGQGPIVSANFGVSAGAAAASHIAPSQDPLLKGTYRFEPHQVQHTDVGTMIWALNAQGHQVILKHLSEPGTEGTDPALEEQITRLSALETPALMKMHGIFTSHSGRWVELEAYRGQTLAERVQAQGPLSIDEVKWWAHRVADSIDAIHKAGLLYLNLTPDAIWLDPTQGQVYLEPFGIFGLRQRGNLGPFGAQELHRSGTHAPGPSTDVYAMAMVLIYALTGQNDPSALAGLSAKATKLTLAKALDVNPSNRPGSAAALVSAAKLGAPGEKFNPLDRKFLLPLAALVVVVTMSVVFLVPDGPPEPYGQANFKSDYDPKRKAVAGAPGQVDKDERLRLVRSFAYAPPEKDEFEAPPVDNTQAAGLLAGVNAKISDESASPKVLLLDYTKAARAGADPGQLKKTMAKLMARPDVSAYYQKRLRTFGDALGASPKLSPTLRRDYGGLSQVVPGASNYTFLTKNRGAQIKKIASTSKEP